MQYVLVLATALFGAASYVLLELDLGNQIVVKILTAIAVMGFIEGCVWRLSHIGGDRRRDGLDLD